MQLMLPELLEANRLTNFVITAVYNPRYAVALGNQKKPPPAPLTGYNWATYVQPSAKSWPRRRYQNVIVLQDVCLCVPWVCAYVLYVSCMCVVCVVYVCCMSVVCVLCVVCVLYVCRCVLYVWCELMCVVCL